MIRVFRLFIILSFLAVLSGCAAKGDTVVLKLAHGLDITHPVHKAMIFMAERAKEKSAGKIRIDIYPSEQLGSERELIEQVQIGCIDMTKTSTAPLESFIPSMGVFSVPYIFRDHDHRWKVLLNPIGKKILNSGEKVGLRGLCYYDAGSRSFYTKDKPVNSPADLKGMKIRVMKSKTSMEMVKELGASPTPISWGELYTSLQQGVVDGAENNPPSFYTSRHYEVCRYYCLDEHTAIPDILLISYVVWKGLPENVRKILQESADESMMFQRKLWKEKTAESMKVVEEAGVEVIYPDKEFFRSKVRNMHERYRGTEIGNILEEIKAVN